MSLTPGTEYRVYLSRELGRRVRRNPKYSLRAFARDLDMQPSKLSEILRGLGGLSGAASDRIARKLSLSPAEHSHFVSLVRAKHERSPRSRRQARAQLEELETNYGFDEIGLERFGLIADWYHFAILELCDVTGFRSDIGWIARRFGLERATAQRAIDRLLRFGLLEKDPNGRLRQTQQNLATPGGIPSAALREHHSQVLSRADDAQNAGDISERDFSTMMLAIDVSRLEEMKHELKKFRRRFAKFAQKSPKKDRVYCLAIQMFPLDVANPEASK